MALVGEVLLIGKERTTLFQHGLTCPHFRPALQHVCPISIKSACNYSNTALFCAQNSMVADLSMKVQDRDTALLTTLTNNQNQSHGPKD